jgi:hypothetical protein
MMWYAFEHTGAQGIGTTGPNGRRRGSLYAFASRADRLRWVGTGKQDCMGPGFREILSARTAKDYLPLRRQPHLNRGWVDAVPVHGPAGASRPGGR